MERLRLGVLASGRGTNFQAIIDAIEAGWLKATVEILIVDKPDAYAIERARRHSIEHLYLNPREFHSKDEFFAGIVRKLGHRHVQLVVLAGFMRIVRKPMIDAFRNRIMNIHPALLPSFPGLRGQRQAIDYGARISGCTVHFVDEGMDTGPVVIQAAVPVHFDDTEETLSERILNMEHKIYPEAIRLYSEGRLKVNGRRVEIKDAGINSFYMINPPLTR